MDIVGRMGYWRRRFVCNQESIPRTILRLPEARIERLSVVSRHEPIKIQQTLRAAEGYLDLIQVFADRWPLRERTRNVIAQRVLDLLTELPSRPKYVGRAHYLQGEALRSMERHREAIDLFRVAEIEHPGQLHVLLALGWCYKRIGHLDDAIEALEDALCVHPDEGILNYNLACYWSLAGETEIALQYLSQAFEIEPSYRDMVVQEPDFDSIRNDTRFQALTSLIV